MGLKWSVAVLCGAMLPGSAFAQAADEVALARAVLSELQPRSIAENREYCGYIGLDGDGQLVATPAEPGTEDSCAAEWPEDIEVLASYHTHAGFDAGAWSEIPSGTDVESDEDEGIDGYVSTPGGRFWYVDTEDMVVSQICGIGCLPADAAFDASVDGVIRQSYSYEDLIEKLDE